MEGEELSAGAGGFGGVEVRTAPRGRDSVESRSPGWSWWASGRSRPSHGSHAISAPEVSGVT